MSGHWDATARTSAALELVAQPDPADDALVDVAGLVLDAGRHAARHPPDAAAVRDARPGPNRVHGASDLAPGTTHRKLVEAALPFRLEDRDGALRPPLRLPGSGLANPLACFAECGDPQCGCNRLKWPHVRGSFASLVLDECARAFEPEDAGSFRSFMASRRLVYASVGSGLLWFDFDVVRRLRTDKKLSVGAVVLVDAMYADETHWSMAAVRAFSSWFADVEVYAFGSLAAYRARLAADPKLMADVLVRDPTSPPPPGPARPGRRARPAQVQCDACTIGRDDVAPLLFFGLRSGGAAFKLYNAGHAPPAEEDDDGDDAPDARRRRRRRQADPLSAVHVEWWRKRKGGGVLACRDYVFFFFSASFFFSRRDSSTRRPRQAGATGWLETTAAASTASLWARLWADERPPVADRARASGRAAFRVRHGPRVAIRDRPSLEGAIVGCLRQGDLCVARAGYDAIWPWICLSSLTDRVGTDLVVATVARRPPPPKLFMLTDGAQLDLGVLLEPVA